MKNSRIAGVFDQKSTEQILEEILFLESNGNTVEKLTISKAILSKAILQAGNSNPELKELFKRELFTNYITTKYVKTLQEIEKKYKNELRLRFRRLSSAELLEYKNYLEFHFYKKKQEDFESFLKESEKIYEQSGQELQKIVIAEGKAMSTTTEK